FDTLLARAGYIFEYTFPMEAEWFTHGFNQRSDLLVTSGMGSFRQVIIHPPDYSRNDAAIFFLCESGYAYEFSVISPDSGADIFEHVIAHEAIGAYYLFTELPWGRQFLRQGEFVFKGIEVVNPYLDPHGNFHLDFIQGQVAGFFSNPGVIRPTVGSDVWIYRDVNTVVRYYAANVLEYISYRAIDRNIPSSFENDFASAVQFLERDHLVINETYLADFREEEGQRIFYFNYVIDNTPLVMAQGQGWLRDFQLRYPVVVTVSHGTVIRYRKLAFNFRVNEDVQINALADFSSLIGRLGNDFTDVRQGYRITGENMRSQYWFVDDRTFVLP
ncbi:MAG: hypothetical protein FWD03_00405, partial [Defluviitaleaceae bacterium]|nr:hypothetical protein [Defluviitaleaceae bacterium]